MDRRRTASLAGVALALAGAALLVSTRLSEARAADGAAETVTHQAEALGQELAGEADAARVRAEALAALPVVRAAIETDVATVKDIERSNKVFQPAHGEAIELFQIGDERTLTLLRAPESAHPLRLDKREVALDDTGDGLSVTVSAPVAPMYEDQRARGAIAIRRRVPLDRLRERLQAAALSATLTGLEAPLTVAGDPADRREPTLSATVPFAGVTLTLHAARRHGSSAPLAAGLALIGLGLVVVVAGRRALPRRETAAPGLTMSLPPTSPEKLDSQRRLQLVQSDEELPSLPLLVPLQPEAPARGDAPVAELVAGKYRIIQSIGAGETSEVYLAQTVQQVGVPKIVAVKLHRPDPQISPEQFLEAMQRASRLQHEHVVRVHDFGVADQRFFAVMDYVEGCSVRCLFDELRGSHEQMPLKQSLTIAIALCRALEAAQALKVGELPAPLVHRELRPSSVLIGRHGAVKLGDFGAVRPRVSDYTAPEQARGQPVDVRADVYSVGVILHELLTGVPARETQGTLPPSSLRPGLQRSLDAVVQKATQPSPRRRYADPAAMRRDLEDVCEAIADPPSSGVLGDWVERVRRSHG